MKKKLIISSLVTGVLALGLIGCGSKSVDDKNIKIGVSPVPHKEIVENIVPQLEKEGYKVELVEFTDYILPNEALASGEIDANYFQHISFLNTTNESKKLDLDYTAVIHLEPIALYSKNMKNVKDLQDGATIAIPNDPSNEARALRLLEKEGLIKLKAGELVTPLDITENTKNFKFKEVAAEQLPSILSEVDAGVINGNYAIEAGLNPNTESLAIEDKDAKAAEIYRNILAVKKENKDFKKIQALTKALTSAETKKFIEEKYNGAVIPTF